MEQSTFHTWPDSLDSAALLGFAAMALALPALGYFFAVVDYRRYLRSLRRAISTIVYRDFETPAWARPQVPRCVAVFELTWPCTEEELTRAYRQKVKTLHPDRGGDERRFRLLQGYFEEATAMVRRNDPAMRSASL